MELSTKLKLHDSSRGILYKVAVNQASQEDF